ARRPHGSASTSTPRLCLAWPAAKPSAVLRSHVCRLTPAVRLNRNTIKARKGGTMRTLDERRQDAFAGVEESAWEDGFARPRVFLQPIAAPSILGLAGFAGATFIVASNLAGWRGTPDSGLTLAPFAAMFGGLAQFLAGMWAFKARDAIATLA